MPWGWLHRQREMRDSAQKRNKEYYRRQKEEQDKNKDKSDDPKKDKKID